MEVYMLYYNSNCDEGEIFIGAFSSVEEINKFTAKAFNTEFNGDLGIAWIPDAVYDEDLRYNIVRLNEVDDLVVDRIKEERQNSKRWWMRWRKSIGEREARVK